MIYRDPKCIFVADSLTLAETVVLWLSSQEIAAQVMNPTTLGGFLGLTLYAGNGVSSTGIEVWILDPAQTERANQLLAEHSLKLAGRNDPERNVPAQIEAVCEECGKTNVFPGKECGTVQACLFCGAYLDVPDPNEERQSDDGAEETTGEEDEPDERRTGIIV